MGRQTITLRVILVAISSVQPYLGQLWWSRHDTCIFGITGSELVCVQFCLHTNKVCLPHMQTMKISRHKIIDYCVNSQYDNRRIFTHEKNLCFILTNFLYYVWLYSFIYLLKFLFMSSLIKEHIALIGRAWQNHSCRQNEPKIGELWLKGIFSSLMYSALFLQKKACN